MSIKVIAQTHPFKTDTVEYNLERKELYKIYSDLETGLDLSHARMLIDDEITTDFSIIPEDDCTVYIKVVPAGGNTKKSGKKLGWLGVLTVVIGTIMVSTGFLAPVGILLIGTGVSAVLGGTVLYNIDIPSIGNTERESVKQNPSIRGSGNKSNPWGTVPVILGRHLIYPNLAAASYTSISGNNQYLHQLFCVGYNDIDIESDSFKIGDTKLVELSETKNLSSILAGTDSIVHMEVITDGSASTIYPVVCKELNVNRIIKKFLDDGSSGAAVNSTPDKTTMITVDIVFQNGLGEYNSEGDIESRSIELIAEYKLTTDPDTAYLPLGYWNGISNVISGSELETKRYQITKIVASGQYDIRLKRTTADAEDSNTIDEVYWTSLKSFTDDRPVRQTVQEKLCVIALKVKATDILNGTIDQFNLVAQTSIKRYSGSGSGPSSWTKALTSNPAAMFLYIMQGQCNSDPIDSSCIDFQALEDWYEWCEENDYTCNAVVSESITITQLLTQIGLTARAEFSKKNGLFTVIQDRVRISPIQLFSPRNTKNFSSTKTFADIPHVLEMQYVSEDAGWADDQRLVYDETGGYGDGTGETIAATKKQTANLWGVTSANQAYKIGRYMFACTYLRPETYTFDCDFEYLLCTKGARALLAHDVPLMGLYWGRIKSRILDHADENFVTGFILDEIISMETGNSYSIKIRMSTGDIITRDIVFAEGESDRVILQLPFDISYSPDSSDHFAFGITGQETVDIIITNIEPMEDLTAKITAVDYSPAIFNVDDPDFVIPPYDPKITVGGTVDDGLTKITPVEQDLYNLVSQRPTYAQIASGFTGGGSSEIPVAPYITASGLFRAIVLEWPLQKNLSNLDYYKVQVSDDGEIWYKPSLDGVDWKDEEAEDNYYSCTANLFVHSNIAPVEIDEETTGRTLYYRVSAITKKEVESAWSETASAITLLTQTGDYAANSITANALAIGVLTAMIANISQSLVIDPNTGYTAGSIEPVEGDERAYLNQKAVAFERYTNGEWKTIARLSLDGLFSQQVYGTGAMFITNDDIAGRRERGFDIGLEYPSENSHVMHFDGDVKDQNGDMYLTIDGSFDYDKEDVAILAQSPFTTEGGALYGLMKLSKDLGDILFSTWWIDFWIKLYDEVTYAEVVKIGNDNNFIRFMILQGLYEYTTKGEAAYAYAEKGAASYDYAVGVGPTTALIVKNGSSVVILPLNIARGSWIHMSGGFADNKVKIVINESTFEYDFASSGDNSLLVVFNNDNQLFKIDELLISFDAEIDAEKAIANTADRIPWAANDYNQEILVIDAKDPDNVAQNLIRSGSVESRGNWIKYPDGTLECNYVLTANISGVVWTFPVEFAEAPVIHLSAGFNAIPYYTGRSTSSVTILVSTSSGEVSCRAIGKWK